MIVRALEEHGYDSAMLGLSLSYEQDKGKMKAVAERLCFKGGGHNKFLESIVVWLDITATRKWWSQMDTYRHVTKQSSSTMHTLTKRELTKEDFSSRTAQETIDTVNHFIREGDLLSAKDNLPEGFLQRRIVCTNYMTLQRMINQRATHKLEEWQTFIKAILSLTKHPEFLRENNSSMLNSNELLCRKM